MSRVISTSMVVVIGLIAGQINLLSLEANAQAAQVESKPGIFALPPVTQRRTDTSDSITYVAASWDHEVQLYNYQSAVDQPFDRDSFPGDSIRKNLSVQARKWLLTLKANEIRGIQLNPYGSLLVASDQDDSARRVFAARLKSPGMTTVDSAVTLSTAVKAFADADVTTRLPVAENYMKQLVTLGADADFWKYQGYTALAQAYLLLGNEDLFVSHTIQSLDILPRLFFRSRKLFYTGDQNIYISLYDALRKKPDGASRIAEINRKLEAAAAPPPSMVAQDSSVLWMGNAYRGNLQRFIASATMLGKPAPVIRGTAWINGPAANSGIPPADMLLNDGIIRIVGVGSYSNAVGRMPAVERVLAQVNSQMGATQSASERARVGALFLVATKGSWGQKFVTPEEETALVKEYFATKRPTKIPIMIWAGTKQPTRNGGMRPSESPTATALRIDPGFAIVDGAGRIRRIFLDSFTRKMEAQAIATILSLLREQSDSSTKH